MPTIILMRHGLPDAPAGEWLTAHGFADWVRRYDAAPVTPACPPPAAALEQARPCGAVVCSDLPRSLSSAALLGVRPAQAARPRWRRGMAPCFWWGMAFSTACWPISSSARAGSAKAPMRAGTGLSACCAMTAPPPALPEAKA